jgi:cysteine desulfurase/selenocysteine lyase
VRGGTRGNRRLSYGDKFIGEGDEIVLTYLEHHSNIVPWQLLAERKGAKIRAVPIDDTGELILEEYEKMLSPRTKMVAVTHASNARGTLPPVKQMIEMAHAQGAAVLIDGCQGAPHLKVDVQDLDCDFYVFSGHKVYGPSGIGALYGKKKHLRMPPWQGGGDMIGDGELRETTFAPPPNKFEAGPPTSQAPPLAAAIDYVTKVDWNNIAAPRACPARGSHARMRQIRGADLWRGRNKPPSCRS